MSHKNEVLADLLQGLDLGSSVAETDELLEVARVETSAFTDLTGDTATDWSSPMVAHRV